MPTNPPRLHRQPAPAKFTPRQSRRHFFVNSSWLLVVSALLAAAPTSQPELQVIRETLAQASIEATPAGALRWLEQIQSPSPLRRQLEIDVLDLASEEYEIRQRAMERLERAPFVPPRLLDAAIQGADAEARWRAQRIRERSENRQTNVLDAVVSQIVLAPPEGTVLRLVDALPLARHADVQERVLKEIRRLATAEHERELVKRLTTSDVALRRGAIAGLTVVSSPDKLPELRPFLDDKQPSVALEAARGLLNRGDRTAIKALVDRLSQSDTAGRVLAFGYLRAVTGQSFGFDPYDPPRKQAAALEAWTTWLERDSATARLMLPLEWHPTGRGDLGGNTLISTGRLGQVLELDPRGEVAWRFPIRAWSAEKLPNGNVLIASLEEQRLVEVDSVGNTRWELPGIGATRAKPLANGNLLVADFAGKRVLEINRRRTIVWQHATGESCFDADRLPNGHTVVGCSNLVKEITPDFRKVREWPIFGRLNGLQALPNGRILVANFGSNEVVELGDTKDELWKYSIPQPSDAFRLSNGHTLITTTSRVVELDGQKQLVREWAKSDYGSARR